MLHIPTAWRYLKTIDDLLFKYYDRYLDEGDTHKTAVDKAHNQLESEGVPFFDLYPFSLRKPRMKIIYTNTKRYVLTQEDYNEMYGEEENNEPEPSTSR